MLENFGFSFMVAAADRGGVGANSIPLFATQRLHHYKFQLVLFCAANLITRSRKRCYLNVKTINDASVCGVNEVLQLTAIMINVNDK